MQKTVNTKIQSTESKVNELRKLIFHIEKNHKLHAEKLSSDFQHIVKLYRSSQKVFCRINKNKIVKKNLFKISIMLRYSSPTIFGKYLKLN